MIIIGPSIIKYAQLLGDDPQTVADHFNAGISAGEWTEQEAKQYIKSQIEEMING